MKQQTSKPRRQKARVRFYTEFFKNKDGQGASCYADLNRHTPVLVEKCICPNPLNCRCRQYEPPAPTPMESMNRELFKHPRPFLLYTIQRGDDVGTRFSFMCKIEQEAESEILRLNSKSKNAIIKWHYKEEIEYNAAAKAEHRIYLEKMSEIERTI